jgi:hypothetical protein
MTKEQIKNLLETAPKEYIKIYEKRFQQVAMKAFIDGLAVMANFVDADGDYKFEWDDEFYRPIKLRNDIDNANAYAKATKEEEK